MTTAAHAIDQLKPDAWASTDIPTRLHLLEAVRDNLKTHGDALAEADANMKNTLMGEDIFGVPESKVATVVPVASTLTACIDLYESLERGDMPKPNSIARVENSPDEILVRNAG